MTKRTASFCLILSILAGSLAAQSFSFTPVAARPVSAATSGYGGMYASIDAGFDTILMNPAALAYTGDEWSIARLSASVSGPLFDLAAVIQDDDLGDAVIDLVGTNQGVYFGAVATGPISFGKVSRNFGFGIFMNTLLNANIPSVTRATIYAGEELLLVGAYGLTVWEKDGIGLSLGLKLKGFFQTLIIEKGSAASTLDTFTSFDVNAIPVIFSTGFGLDGGIMYSIQNRIRIGIYFQDMFTPVFSTRYASMSDFLSNTPNSDTQTERLDMNISTGVMYQIRVPETWITLTSWKIMADYRDILGLFRSYNRNMVLNFAIGTEVVLLDVISLRVGMYEAYPSTGIGIDLGICSVDFAMYGRELGIEPGEKPVLNLDLSFSFTY